MTAVQENPAVRIRQRAHRREIVGGNEVINRLSEGDLVFLHIWGINGTEYQSRDIRLTPVVFSSTVFDGMSGDYDWSVNKKPKQPRFLYRKPDDFNIHSLSVPTYSIIRMIGAIVEAEVSNDCFIFDRRIITPLDEEWNEKDQKLRRYGR